MPSWWQRLECSTYYLIKNKCFGPKGGGTRKKGFLRKEQSIARSCFWVWLCRKPHHGEHCIWNLKDSCGESSAEELSLGLVKLLGTHFWMCLMGPALLWSASGVTMGACVRVPGQWADSLPLSVKTTQNPAKMKSLICWLSVPRWHFTVSLVHGVSGWVWPRRVPRGGGWVLGGLYISENWLHFCQLFLVKIYQCKSHSQLFQCPQCSEGIPSWLHCELLTMPRTQCLAPVTERASHCIISVKSVDPKGCWAVPQMQCGEQLWEVRWNKTYLEPLSSSPRNKWINSPKHGFLIVSCHFSHLRMQGLFKQQNLTSLFAQIKSNVKQKHHTQNIWCWSPAEDTELHSYLLHLLEKVAPHPCSEILRWHGYSQQLMREHLTHGAPCLR